MNRALLWAWGTFIGVSAVAFMLTGSVAHALALGALASFCAWAAAVRVTQQWRGRADAFAAAARGISVDPGTAPGSDDDPVRLAHEVQAAAITSRENTRKLSVLRAVIDGMAEGVWITSEDGTVIEHNNALKEFLYTGQEIAGHRPRDLFESAELHSAVQKACREGVQSRLELNVEGVRPCVLSVHVSPLGRELAGSSAVFFDVTELRRLEKVRKDFVANVSHELRTPITAIRGYAETLQSGALHDPVAAPKMVDIIHRQSERLSELVEDLLELSRLESRQIQLAEKPVELLEATQRALEAVRPKAKPRGTAIEVQVPPNLFVLGDQRAIEQIVLNLVDNAVKYSPPNGRVEISASRRDGHVEMRVKDNGTGIEARHLSRIFERFYRVDKGRSREMGGTGLGLSIVKHLITTMKGDVRCESAPGVGSTFFLEFRVADPTQAAAPAPATAEIDSARVAP
jgi:two-component system phosphate regulon sensor histidine kinase PhoR